MNNIYREITPLNPGDCFTFFKRNKACFDFPLHFHEEFELNYIVNAAGAKRIVGDNIEVIQQLDLVLVGSNLSHAWFTHECTNGDISEITVQFHRDLFDDKLLRRNQLSHIRALLDSASRGISFSQQTIAAFAPRLDLLTTKSGFDSVLELLSLLHDLSLSRDMHMLASSAFSNDKLNYNSRRIEKAYDYMQTHYDKDVSLADVAKTVNMSEVSFSRFIKKRTGRTFVDSLNEIRLGHASRLLIDTTQTIAEISFKCGFNNLSYFNRIFRKKNGCTPTEFRLNYSGVKVFI